jgi:hypothetical protein
MNQRPDNDDDAEDIDLLRLITEYRGRRQRLLPPQFPENEVVAGPYPLDVNFLGAGYVPAFPNLDAVIVSANGERIFSEGGYIRLPSGNYKIYYVDRHEQYKVLPDAKATTLDGATVTITCGITYTVNDAMAVQNVRNPLDALFKACEAGIRQVIRTHKHDEIIDERPDREEQTQETEPGGLKVISNSQISDAIKLQVNLSEACRAFTLHNVNILDRQGHTRLLNVREEEAVQVRAGKKEIKQTEIKTRIAEKQKLLSEQQGSVIEQQATNELKRREILYIAEKLQVRLERMRKLPGYGHQENLKVIEARSEALKTLMQAQAMPGSSRNVDELQRLVEKIISDMPNISQDAAAASSTNNTKELSDDFIELLIPKKKK